MDPAPATSETEIDSQRDALRIQVAAVAAQQAALLEEESRLLQQQEALTRQQEQLSAHLDEKRQRVLHLANQVQTARTTLEQERQEHANAWIQQTEELARRQKAIETEQKRSRAERQRVLILRRRMKKHCLRQLAGERKQISKREAAVSDQHQRIEREAEKVQREREELVRARLSLNGDMELVKRQLQAEREKLAAEQGQWREERGRKEADFAARAHRLRQREDALANAEQMFGEQKQDWELKRQFAEQEAKGLEERIANQRRKLNELTAAVQPDKTETFEIAEAQPPPILVKQARTIQATALQLDSLADELVARRLELVEFWQRLALTHQEWEKSRARVLGELITWAESVSQKQKDLDIRQAALDKAETAMRQRHQELARFRQNLKGWAARVRIKESAWDSERDRLLAELRGREEVAETYLQALAALRRSWAQRRLQEMAHLSAERAACEQLREDCAALREECWKRDLSLEQQQRELAEKTLALEEFREQLVLRSDDPSATESRLERLRKGWAQQNAVALRVSAEQFERLKAEASRLQQRGRDLLQIAEELTNREANLSQRQSGWEQTLALAEAEQGKLQQQLVHAEIQREQCEQQIAALQAEVDRLARLLLDSAETPMLPPARAA
ncbi:MAG TPA: hypothetical protein VE988_10995 [Gemmataceae bacterium]|nr:hypothetical protein [Gemmataceae bacterium]